MKREITRRYVFIAENVAAASIILVLFLLLSPPARKMQEAKSRSIDVRNSLQAAENWKRSHDNSTMHELAESYRECIRRYESITEAVPEEYGSGKIVKKLFSYADKVDVKIDYIETGGVNDRELFGEIPVRLEAAGRFDQMEEYIRMIEQFDQLFRIDLIRVDGEESVPSGIRAEMLIKVIVRKGW